MTAPAWLAAAILFLHLPIPLFWFVFHPQVNFWRRHQTAGYVTGVLAAWLPVTAGLIVFHRRLFRLDWPPPWKMIVGLVAIATEGWIFWRVHRDLGVARLIGKPELSGGGEMVQQGIYARVRHPRYTGSMIALFGACLLAGTKMLWCVAGAWCLLTLVAIAMEERELRARFGTAYEEYCRRVPRFCPLRTGSRSG